jgi:hypothetical protein
VLVSALIQVPGALGGYRVSDDAICGRFNVTRLALENARTLIVKKDNAGNPA